MFTEKMKINDYTKAEIVQKRKPQRNDNDSEERGDRKPKEADVDSDCDSGDNQV